MERSPLELENNVESIKDKVEKLEAMLANDLDKKVYLTHMGYGHMYSVGEWGDPEQIVNGKDDEVSRLFSEVYGSYYDSVPLGEVHKYEIPMRPENNAVTEQSAGEASFTLRDFFEDMKNLPESK